MNEEWDDERWKDVPNDKRPTWARVPRYVIAMARRKKKREPKYVDALDRRLPGSFESGKRH
jgi:hypothetical protein